MDYYLDSGCFGNVFAVPGAVVDEYIKLASGSAVKVLLYILRNNGRNVSDTEIAAAINISEDDVKDAFNFWEGVGILGTSFRPDLSVRREPEKRNEPVKPASVSAAPEAESVSNSTPINPAVQTSSASFQITPSEIDALRQSSNEMKGLFDMAQQAMNTTINHTMVRSLVWQNQYLGLKPEVILALLSYCSSIGKTHTSYIEAIAVRWSKDDINTFEKADAEITRLKSQHTFLAKMNTAFGLKRQPTSNQQKFFDEWMMKGYSADLVACACERAVDQGKNLTVNYVNGILENWKKKGITTREQAEDEAKSKKGSSYRSDETISYDISKFEEFCLSDKK